MLSKHSFHHLPAFCNFGVMLKTIKKGLLLCRENRSMWDSCSCSRSTSYYCNILCITWILFQSDEKENSPSQNAVSVNGRESTWLKRRARDVLLATHTEHNSSWLYYGQVFMLSVAARCYPCSFWETIEHSNHPPLCSNKTHLPIEGLNEREVVTIVTVDVLPTLAYCGIPRKRS